MSEVNDTPTVPSPEANLSEMNLNVRLLASYWLNDQADSIQGRKKQRYDSMSDYQPGTRAKNDHRRIADCLEDLIDKGHIENWFHVDMKRKFKFPVDLVIFLSDETVMPLKVASTTKKGGKYRKAIKELYGQTAEQVLPVFQYIDYNGYPISQKKMAERMMAIIATGPQIKF